MTNPLFITNGWRVDPNYANFGIAIPQLQQFDERTIADYFADPAVIIVVPRDPSFPRDSIPSYVAECVSLGSFIQDKHCFPPSEEICVKILDFGRGGPISRSRYITAKVLIGPCLR